MKKKKLLDSIDVKSPCNENWDEMFGNEEVRFCSHCAKNVHNLSAMTRQKAEELVKNSNSKLCVRYVKNPNGKIVTAPPTLTKITRRATIAASILATSLTLSTIAYSQGEPIVKKDKSTQTQKDTAKKDETNQGFATISGTVKDANDAVVVGAKVTLFNAKTKEIRLVQTNDSGGYEFKGVEPSIYELTVESPGFKKSLHQNIEILKETKLERNVILEVGEATVGVVDIVKEPPVEIEEVKLPKQTIEQKPLIAPPQVTQTVTMGYLIKDLPITSRNVLDLLKLQPTEQKKEEQSKSKKKKN